jgi:cytochrome c2
LAAKKGLSLHKPALDQGAPAGARGRLVWRIIVILAWLATLGAAFLGGAIAYRDRDAIMGWFKRNRTGVEVIQTGLYNISVEKIEVPAQGRDGAIESLGDGILFVNRLGESWFADKDLKLRHLGLRVPINYEEFVADPFNANTKMRDRFAVKDILVQRNVDGGIRLLASYNFWRSSEACYFLRVASLETTEHELLGAGTDINGRWQTVFDTVPCRGLTPSSNGTNLSPTLGAGGRLASLSSSEVLLSVGGFGAETLTDESVAPPSGPRSYGSTVLINLATGESRNYTKGHRNPQGLAITSKGEIWMTDHGARGGDELNLIIEGRDYGHPTVSYGTEYESMTWRRNPRQGRHDSYEKPIYAWVPSIATSQLAVVEKPRFANWQGNLLVTSLKAQTLFRVQVEDGRVIFAEPIPLGHRIRDIAESADGSVVLKTDDNLLVYLRPIDSRNLYRLNLPPEARGQVLASTCASCHAMAPDAPGGIGPNLWGVVGRPVATREGYNYSLALKSVEGTWSRESLTRFLRDPQAFAPGSSMVMTTQFNEREIEDLVAYLSRLH